MDKTRWCWYAPTHGDGYFVGAALPERAGTPEYISKVARAAENAGFDSILIPAGPTCTDAFITSTHIVTETQTLRPLIAVRPGFVSPTMVAKMAATLDHISNGRVSLNIVTGGSPMELAMDGDFLDHDGRYRRTDEFTEILKMTWTHDSAYSYDGEFFRIENSITRPKPVQRPYPRLYLGGTSEPAIEVAARHVDTYLMWGEPVEMVREQLARVSDAATRYQRSLRFGLRINIVVADTELEAWDRAREMISRVDHSNTSRLARYFRNSDSTSLARIQSLRNHEWSDKCFWTGMTEFRSGNSTALVGSVDQIAESLYSYRRAGISEFIFSAYPHLEACEFVGTRLMPILKTL